MRARDAIYGQVFCKRIKNMGINAVISARKSPWQNPYVERMIGSLRRYCLDHVIVLHERHLKKILSSYVGYYHNDRTHYALDKDTPFCRPVEVKPDTNSKLIQLPQLGGLHHRYEWRHAAWYFCPVALQLCILSECHTAQYHIHF